MNHLIDFGVCALVGCTNYKILHNYFLKDILSTFWVFKFDATSKSPIIRRKAKRKVHNCQTVKWVKRV